MVPTRRAAAVREVPQETVEPEEEEALSPEEEEARAVEQRVFRVSGVTYLHIPSRDAYESSRFYEAVFGWSLRGNPEHPQFDDGTGHVLGTWVTHRPPLSDAGILPYIYVESLDETLDKVCAHGGEIRSMPFKDGDSWIATFADPSANTIGIWQRGGR